MKQKVADIDKQFLNIKSNPKTSENQKKPDKIKGPDRKIDKKVTKEDVACTTEKIVKMDL